MILKSVTPLRRIVMIWVGTAVVSFSTVPRSVIAQSLQSGGSVPLQNAIRRYYGVRSTAVPKIINGEDATWDNNKWQVALLVSWIVDASSAQFCGGSLIRQNWIATAAHCVDNNTSREHVHVLTGTANLKSGGKRSNVEAIFVHKDYDPNSQNNDIALLRLKDDGVGEAIRPVALDKEPVIVSPGQMATISGWGVTESGYPSPQLKKILVPLVSRETCNSPASYDGHVTDKMICAGVDQGGKDSCQGDSGGPATKDEFLIGIVSWGEGCGKPFKYGVYTRVAEFANWIEECVRESESCKSK